MQMPHHMPLTSFTATFLNILTCFRFQKGVPKILFPLRLKMAGYFTYGSAVDFLDN